MSSPGLVEYGFEAFIRIAELLGVGMAFTIFDLLLAGKRYRPLSTVEAAFAKTYFTDAELALVFLDERARWVAKPLRIAYVVGFVIKTYGSFTRSLLVHELVHVRQYRRWGWAYTAKALMAQWTGDGYEVPAHLAFSKTPETSPKRGLSFHPALNAEQEARRLEESMRFSTG